MLRTLSFQAKRDCEMCSCDSRSALLHLPVTSLDVGPSLGSEFKGGINGHDIVTLEPHNGGTKVTDVYEHAIPIPLVGKIAEMLLKKQNEREGEHVLANLKARVEAGA